MRAAADEVLHAVANLRYRASQEQAIAADASKMLKAASMLRLNVVRLQNYLKAHPSDEQPIDRSALRALRHDARTPINQILGYCELVTEEAQEVGDGRWTEDLAAIEQLVRAMLEDINQLRERQDSEVAAVVEAEASDHRAHTEPLEGTVLVVDDNRSNREILSRRLERDGLGVVTATQGAEALAICREQSVDVVLLDIMMPVMDGYETLDRIKADPALRHLPVVMLSSLDEPASITRCIEHGAEDHLPKPFDPVLLRARIGSCLEKKRIRDREREYLARIVAEKRRADDLIHGVIPLGVALAAERDFNRLLERVLVEARHFCGADGGVISLCNDEGLEHMKLQCESLDLSIDDMDKRTQPFPPRAPEGEPEPPLAPEILAAREGRIVNISDLSTAAEFDLSVSSGFDERFGYTIQSLVAVPLRDGTDEIIGVLSLWNATEVDGGTVVPFSPGMVEVLTSMSMLAGAALKSYRRETELRRRIRHLEIRVDEANRRREVSQITETDYFRNLRDVAQRLRASAKSDH